jgi:hypothetical protein
MINEVFSEGIAPLFVYFSIFDTNQQQLIQLQGFKSHHFQASLFIFDDINQNVIISLKN